MNRPLRVATMVSAPLDPTLPTTPWAGGPEAAAPEAATPEAATPEAATPEAATPEAATPEAATQGALLARLQALEARVAALEAARGAEAEPEAVEGAATSVPLEPEAIPGGTVLGLAGRTCLILGGAFLIRALTDAGTLPAAAGVALGLAYAAFWACHAHRSGLRKLLPWAAFQLFAAAAITFPLLWETTVRLGTLPPALASAVLLLGSLLFLTVAIHHGLRRVAWMTALGSLATGFCIMAPTSAIVAFCPFFILASGAALLLSDHEDWRGLRWPAALAADLALLAMTFLALAPGSEALTRDLQPGRVLALALVFLGLHLGVFLYRILTRPKAVGGYELFQTLAVLAVGLGGAVLVGRAAGGGILLLGSATLAAGLVCYGCAFAFVGRQTEGSLDFKYLTPLALALVLAGSLLLLRHQALALVCLASGVAVILLGVRFSKFSLQFHGAIFLALAALDSGLLEGAARAFLAPVPPGLGSFPAGAWLVCAALVGAHLYPLERRGRQPLPWPLRLPSLVFGVLAVLTLGGLAAAGLGTFVTDPGLLTALRTGLLVALALGTALTGPWLPASELVWLPYPLLGCAALKLLLEDLPNGKPATLFLAFTLFGCGLVLVPRVPR